MTGSAASADALRQQCIHARRSLTASYRATASRRINESFLASRYFLSSGSIACYLAAWDEVDTSAIFERAWRAKKRIFAPVVEKHSHMSFRRILPDTTLVRNCFGLWEPEAGERIEPRGIDIVVTPVVVFDSDRNRIGMGSGYFDRCFAFLNGRQSWHRPKLVGFAFDCQKAEKIAPNPWDIPLSCVVTETS